MINAKLICRGSAGAITAMWIGLMSPSAPADPLWYDGQRHTNRVFHSVATDSAIEEDSLDSATVSDRLRRRIVDYPTRQPPGTIIIDTANTYLYYVLVGGKAVRYGIGVGREGFTWSGVKNVERLSEWPDWIPPVEMIQRQPYLPRLIAGGPQNPLGARAIYLSGTLYRIHGTNVPSSIGKRVSSGCIRMLNEDVIDLYARVHVGTKVIVLPNRVPPVSVTDIASRAQPTGRHGPSGRADTVEAFGLY